MAERAVPSACSKHFSKGLNEVLAERLGPFEKFTSPKRRFWKAGQNFSECVSCDFDEVGMKNVDKNIAKNNKQ